MTVWTLENIGEFNYSNHLADKPQEYVDEAIRFLNKEAQDASVEDLDFILAAACMRVAAIGAANEYLADSPASIRIGTEYGEWEASFQPTNRLLELSIRYDSETLREEFFRLVKGLIFEGSPCSLEGES